MLSLEVKAETEVLPEKSISIDAVGRRLLEFRKHFKATDNAFILTLKADAYENTSDEYIETDTMGGFSTAFRTRRASKYGLGVGYRNYMTQSTLRYFADTTVQLTYDRAEDINNGSQYSSNFTTYEKGVTIYWLFGAEYHLSQYFSVEGRVGLEAGYTDISGDSKGHAKRIDTVDSGIMINLYF